MAINGSSKQTAACARPKVPRPPDPTHVTLHGVEPTMSNELTRRQFLSAGAAASVAALPTPGALAGVEAPAEVPQRRFYSILSLGRLGFQATFPESLELAVKHGFPGLDPDL